MKNSYLMTLIIAIVVGIATFFGGMTYQKSKSVSTSQFGNRGVNNRQPGAGGTQIGQQNRMGFRPVTGAILSIDSGTMTVKLDDGSSKIILLPDSTQIEKTAQAAKTDLVVGTQVAVIGQANSDGSVTAQTVQLNPIRRDMGTASPQPTK